MIWISLVCAVVLALFSGVIVESWGLWGVLAAWLGASLIGAVVFRYLK